MNLVRREQTYDSATLSMSRTTYASRNHARKTVPALVMSLLLVASCGSATVLSPKTASRQHVGDADQNFPEKSDFVMALKDIDNEFCRQSIDICDGPMAREKYDINILRCDLLYSNKTNCRIQDIRNGSVFRVCKIIMKYNQNETSARWLIARGRKGNVPFALLSTCKDL